MGIVIQSSERMVPHWYAVYTRSRHEQRVRDLLAGKQFDLFLPQVEVWSRRLDRRKRIRQPLFPGYLFVRCAMDPHLHVEILSTFGVVRLLGGSFGGEANPQPIPDVQIESVRKLLEGPEEVGYYPYPKAGDRVRVKEGPLKGAEGILLRASPERGRLVVSIDLLGRSIAVEIDYWLVERL